MQIREAKKAALLEQMPKPAANAEEGNETEAEESELAQDDAPNVSGGCLQSLLHLSEVIFYGYGRSGPPSSFIFLINTLTSNFFSSIWALS